MPNPIFDKRKRLFLSYARQDDEPFVKRLYEDLTTRGFNLWWDRVAMPSRDLTFLQEIRDAITGVDRLLLVIGPHAVASDYVRVEWEYAREICTPVNPILRKGDFDLLPDDLKNLDTRDFRDDDVYTDQLDRLVEQLREDIPPLGRLINVPALPPCYLPRPEHLDAIGEHVLSDIASPTVITAERKTTAVQGMGGIGKTVIVTAFTHACTTRRAFSDGIVWVTVGQRAELRVLYEVAGVGLGDTPQSYREEIAARANLQKMLADKTCLIVLDDVWQMEHAAPFRDLVADGRSRLLITTRDGGLAAGLGAHEHTLDLLRDELALALLAEWADLPVDALPDEAPDVMRECGNLPLALAMIGATVRGKPDRWRHVLYRLRTADLGKIRQRFPNYPYESVLSAIQVGVDDLEPECRVRYLDFAVFREDTRIPETAVITLWEQLGLDEFDAIEVIDDLVVRSLVRREGDGRLVLHDLQVDYVRNGDVRQDAGAEPVLALHKRLLAAYRAKCSDGWPSGPNDGYFFENLAYHLRETRRKNELHTLLTESASDGGPNPWLETKFAACVGDTSYAADLTLALSGFVDPLEPDQLLDVALLYTARQVVYARVSNYLDVDLKTLAWLGREQEALSHARLRSEASARFDGLMAIYEEQKQLSRTDTDLLDECFRVTENIRNDAGRAKALCVLASTLFSAAQTEQATIVFSTAREVIGRIQDTKVRSFALSDLSEALAQAACYTEAYEVAECVRHEEVRAKALREVAFNLILAEQTDQAISVLSSVREVADRIQDAEVRSTELSELAVNLILAGQTDQATGAFSAARDAANHIQDTEARVSALGDLAFRLDAVGETEQAETAFCIAYEMTNHIQDTEARVRALGGLAFQLDMTAQTEQANIVFNAAHELASSIQDESSQAGALRDLVFFLAYAERGEQAHEVASSINDKNIRANALGELASVLILLEHRILAREVSNEIEDEDVQAEVFHDLAIALGQAGQGEQSEAVLSTAHEVIRHIRDYKVRVFALCALAVALDQAAQIKQAEAVFSIAREIIDLIADGEDRSFSLRILVLALAKTERYSQARDMADHIQDEKKRVYTLCALAAALAKADQIEQAKAVFLAVREVTDRIQDVEARSCELRTLVATLISTGQIEQAMVVFSTACEVTNNIQDAVKRVWALSDLAACQVQAGQTAQAHEIFSTAREVAMGIQDVERQSNALYALVSILARAGDFNLAHEVVKDIQDEVIRPIALRDLAIGLAKEGHYPHAREIVDIIGVELERAEALRTLASALAQIGNIVEAFDALGPQRLDEYIQAMCDWDLPVDVLQSILRITGWIRPDWREIYELLTAEPDA